MKKVAVVILNWNGEAMLRQFLPNVVAHTLAGRPDWDGDVELWVADNASTDGSMAFLSSAFPDVKTLLLDQNYGFADGYNRALRQIEATYYVLLNSDVEVTAGWLTPLLRHMDAHRDVSACQPKLLSQVDKTQFEYAGACGGFVDKFGYPYCRGRIFGSVEPDKGQYDAEMEVHWATGACLMVRAADYWLAEGLDGRFFAHNEEIDLCWRLRLMGHKIMCIPSSVVYHVGGGTLPQGNPRKTYLNFRNNLAMLYKNLPEHRLKSVMRARWWLDRLAVLEAVVLHGNVADAKAILKARRDFKAWIPQLLASRYRMQAMRYLRADGLAPMSILWQYYARGKRRFADLPKAE